MSFSTGLRNRRWTAHDHAELRRMAAAGAPTRAIARHLGRTGLAVRIMACRLRVKLDSPRGRPRRVVAVSTTVNTALRVLCCPIREARRLAFLAAEALLDRLHGVSTPPSSPPPASAGAVWRVSHPLPTGP